MQHGLSFEQLKERRTVSLMRQVVVVYDEDVGPMNGEGTTVQSVRAMSWHLGIQAAAMPTLRVTTTASGSTCVAVSILFQYLLVMFVCRPNVDTANASTLHFSSLHSRLFGPRKLFWLFAQSPFLLVTCYTRRSLPSSCTQLRVQRHTTLIRNTSELHIG